MPPRPPLQRNEACLTCRTRKVKCGAQKPRCHTCLRYAVSRGLDPSQVVCEYVQVSFGGGAKPGVGASPAGRKDGQEEREKRAERIKSLEGKISELERLLEIQSYQILLAYKGGAADSLPFPPSQSSLPATTTIASSANQQSLSLSLAPIDLSPKSLTTSPILASPLSTFPDFASLDPPSKNIVSRQWSTGSGSSTSTSRTQSDDGRSLHTPESTEEKLGEQATFNDALYTIANEMGLDLSIPPFNARGNAQDLNSERNAAFGRPDADWSNAELQSFVNDFLLAHSPTFGEGQKEMTGFHLYPHSQLQSQTNL